MLLKNPISSKTKKNKALKDKLARKCIRMLKSRIKNPKAKKILDNPDKYKFTIHIDTPFTIKYQMDKEYRTTFITVVAVVKSKSVHIHWSEHDKNGDDADTTVYAVKNFTDFENILQNDFYLHEGEELSSDDKDLLHPIVVIRDCWRP
jgi:hypothetical protein